jgi:hypothetical protein
MKRLLSRIAQDAAREELQVQNPDDRWASRQEILRRLNADEELLGWPKARSPEADEDERKRKIEEEYGRRRFIRSYGCN